MSAVSLPPRPSFGAALATVYAAQLARVRTARVPLLFVASLQSVGLLVLLRGVVDGTHRAEKEQIVAGAVVLVIAFVALNLLAQRFGQLAASGALDFYAALAVPPPAVVLGTAASYATFALPGTVLVALVGAPLYGLPMGQLWLVVPVALAGAGAALGLWAPRPEIATVAGQLGMTVVLFLGFVRGSRLPVLLRGIRAVVPSTYAVDALREALHPTLDVGAVVVDLAVCLAVGAVGLGLAGLAFRRAVTRVRGSDR